MAGTSAAARVPGEERLFSLVLALVASPQGLTKHDLLSSVYGYADTYRSAASPASLERKFERDKEELRTLGLPLETLDSPLEPGNNQLTRYRISKDQLQVPRGVRFTGWELMILRLAAGAWREGSLSAESRRALIKLESLGAPLDVRFLGVAPKVGMTEPQAEALQRAIRDAVQVTFAYQRPDQSDAVQRKVAPLRLHRAEGRWHLISWDLEREAIRVFLLSRMVGRVTLTTEPVAPHLFELADDAVGQLLQRTEQLRVSLAVRRGSTAESRLLPRARTAKSEAREAAQVSPGDWATLNIGTLDTHTLAGELAGYGADVVVLSPSSLREELVAVLTEVSVAHSLVGHGTGAGEMHHE